MAHRENKTKMETSLQEKINESKAFLVRLAMFQKNIDIIFNLCVKVVLLNNHQNLIIQKLAEIVIANNKPELVNDVWIEFTLFLNLFFI